MVNKIVIPSVHSKALGVREVWFSYEMHIYVTNSNVGVKVKLINI